MTTDSLFSDNYVYSLIQEYLDGHLVDFATHVTARGDNGSLIVEVRSGLDIDCERGPERFRVTVERVTEGAN